MIIALLLLFAVQANSAPIDVIGKAEEAKIQCRAESSPNSRIANRICLPKSEWDRIAKENADDLASSRNERSAGLAGTMVPDGAIVSPSLPHEHGPGPH